MAFDPVTAPVTEQSVEPVGGPGVTSGRGPAPEPRPVPWFRVAVTAGVGLVGLLVALAVLAPVLVLGGLLWLVLLGVVGWRLALHTWDQGSTVSDRPDAAHVEALAEAHRAAARERHARTVAVVAAHLVGPGFTRRDQT